MQVLLAAPKCNPLARDENRRTALHHLCLGGHDKALLAKELAEHGGQKLLDAQDAFGCSAMHYAAQKGMVNVLKVGPLGRGAGAEEPAGHFHRFRVS